MPQSAEPVQTLIIDLVDCCLTENYWHQILKPYWAQNLPSFLAERWSAATFQSSFASLAAALDATDTRPLHSPDALSYSEKLVRCIQEDQWPKGLASLLSQMVSLGIGTHYLEAQIHVDAINSLRRWHQRGWRVITVSELSSLAQRHLLQHTQSGDLSTYISYHIPLNAKLPNLERCALISARPSVLSEGKMIGYQTLRLNRMHGDPSRGQSTDKSTDKSADKSAKKNANPIIQPDPSIVEILEMDLADLLLTK